MTQIQKSDPQSKYIEQLQKFDDQYLKIDDFLNISEKDDWLSNFQILAICHTIQLKYTFYYFMGVCIWYQFEQNGIDQLSIRAIKDAFADKNIMIIGWVINVCHDLSSGQHWVSLICTRDFQFYYFDSQDNTDPLKKVEIICNFRDGLEATAPQHYKPYKSQMKAWYDNLIRNNMAKGMIFNSFPIQQRNFDCGYFAILFQYSMAKQWEQGAVLNVDYIALRLNQNKNIAAKLIDAMQATIFNYDQIQQSFDQIYDTLVVDGGTYKEILKKIGGIIKGAKAKKAKAGANKKNKKDKRDKKDKKARTKKDKKNKDPR